jgi:hypothetical protein
MTKIWQSIKRCFWENRMPKSDVLEVNIVRKAEDGKLWKMSLVGEDAEAWGRLVILNQGYYRTDPILHKTMGELKWQKTLVEN